MKKIVRYTLAVAALGFALPGIGWAAVAGTPHDITTAAPTLATFGVCSACHIPHKAFGARLWPTDQSALPAARGTVGALCSFCHAPGAGQYPSAETPYPFKDIAGYTQTHGLTKGFSPDGADALTASGMPYTATGALLMECTSCHNVHDNATNTQPFLQQVAGQPQDIDRLCAACHPNRQFVAGAATVNQGAWGAANMGYVAGAAIGNPGSHPVGTDVFSDASGPGNSPITTTQIGVGGVLPYFGPAGPGIGNWNLGPHLIDGTATTWQNNNGMGCVTCHAPHGINNDLNTVNQAPTPDLLANAQGSQGSSANGMGDPNNALCEACHRGAVPGFVSAYFPNPGAVTLLTHPVDDYYPSGDIGVVGLPLNWPTGSGGENVPDLICESCHAPHPLALKDADTLHTDQLPGTYAGNDSHILRDYDNAICDDCHSGGVIDHHPIGAGLLGGRFVTTTIGDGDANLECSDCHNGAGGHNWVGGVGLDPDWIPPNNARPGSLDECNLADRYAVNMSSTCIDCHTNAGAHYSPTNPSAPEAEYQDAGDASHFLGPRGGGYAGWTWGGTALTADGAPGVGNGNTFLTTTWDVSGGWSCMGGPNAATGELVCESCHELEPDKNAPGTKLLLYPSLEATAEPRSLFCEGCHSAQGTQLGNPHPMTLNTISRAQTAERVPTTLITTIGPSFAERGAQGDTTYPAAEQMNCDSCHQVHDAVNTSGTYILENTTGGGTGPITGAPAGAIAVSGFNFAGQKYDTSENGAAKLNYQPFCNLCHLSGN